MEFPHPVDKSILVERQPTRDNPLITYYRHPKLFVKEKPWSTQYYTYYVNEYNYLVALSRDGSVEIEMPIKEAIERAIESLRNRGHQVGVILTPLVMRLVEGDELRLLRY